MKISIFIIITITTFTVVVLSVEKRKIQKLMGLYIVVLDLTITIKEKT